jgi:murein DD-endopeptidase MepM/ murein hydrolase activator NlpD
MNPYESPPCTVRISISDMMALRVRAHGSNVPLPEFLYQSLPARAMTLLATLPRGDIQVSIPHQNDPDSGYPIEKNFPSASDGFILVYALQPNRHYRVAEVFYRGNNFDIAQFCSIAAKRVEAREGKITIAPGLYVYLSPTVERWGAILRDSGYIAADPSKLSSEISMALKQSRQGQLASGVFIRMPVQMGDKQPFVSAPPSFSRVELTLDTNPGDRSHWLSFEEYQSARARKSRLPEILIRFFRDWQKRLTKESGFESWIFLPGMLFSDHIEWWGNRNRRRTEHEGIDFALGQKPDGSVQNIPAGTPVRAISDGEIVAVLDDFLGKTIVVQHPEIRNQDSAIFHTLYSHIQTEEGLSGRVSKGQILGRIGKSKSINTPMHLHLTAAWIPKSIRPKELTMNHIHPAFAPIMLVDFGVHSSEFPVQS